MTGTSSSATPHLNTWRIFDTRRFTSGRVMPVVIITARTAFGFFGEKAATGSDPKRVQSGLSTDRKWLGSLVGRPSASR